MTYKNGDVVFAEDINKAINDSTTAVNTANTAKTASDKASADVIDLGKQIGTKQGTTVTVGGVAQANVAFTSDPQTQIATLNENKVSIAFTDSTGAQNYVGKNVGNMNLNSGTHIFTNCTGSVILNGNTAKIYAVNSPNLTITGKTGANWRNISVDGISEYVVLNAAQTFDLKTMSGDILTNLPVLQIGDEVLLDFNFQFVTYSGSSGTMMSKVFSLDSGAGFSNYTNIFNSSVCNASFDIYYRNNIVQVNKCWSNSSLVSNFNINCITVRRYAQ